MKNVLFAVLMQLMLLSAATAAELKLDGGWKFFAGDDPAFAGVGFDDSAWKAIKVPGFWKRAGFPADGIGWYRTRIALPDAADRPLQLVLEGVARCDETYFNGQLIGRTGDFSDADSNYKYQMRRYDIPPELVKAENVVAIRVFPGREIAGGGLVRPVVLRELPASEALAVTAGADAFYREPGESLVCRAEVRNRLRQPREAVLRSEVRDFSGTLLASREWPVKLEGGGHERFELDVKLPEVGIYTVSCALSVNGEIQIRDETKVAVLPPENAGSRRDPRFGVAAHLNWWDRKTVLQSLDLMRRAGIAAVRTGFIWNEIQPDLGDFSFVRTDLIVDEAAKRGITVLPVVSGVPAAAVAGKARNPAMPLAREADRSAFLRALFGRYCAAVPVWEFDNEPNLNKYAPEEYGATLECAIAAATECTPKPEVIVGGLSSVNVKRPGRIAGDLYLEALYACAPGFSGVAFHPYIGWPGSNGRIAAAFLESIDSVIAVMKSHGGASGGLRLTEYSTSVRPDQGRTELDQARFLVVTTVSGLTRGEVRGFYWYNFRNKGFLPTDNEMNYGLINWDFSPRTAFVAYAVLIDRLRFLNFVGSRQSGKAVIHEFEDDSRKVLVAWTDSGTETVELADVAGVVDLAGRPEPADGGKIEITTLPKYITIKK